MTMTDIQYGDKVMLNDKYYVIQSNYDTRKSVIYNG